MLVPWALAVGLAVATTQTGLLGVDERTTEAELERAELVDDMSAVFVPLSGIEPLPDPTWIRHRLRRGDRLTAIAVRYGVELEDLMRWNRLDPNTDMPAGRRTLRVLARRNPPPRRLITARARAGEDWDAMAARLRVAEHELRVLNWRVRALAEGVAVTAWIDPIEGPTTPPTKHLLEVEGLPPISGSISVGLPQRGKLLGGIVLPEHPLWIRGDPGHLFASAHTIRQIHAAFTNLRRDKGYSAGILVGSISRKHGGKFPPHRSHQSGRDVDIRLPLVAGLPVTPHPNADQIDWYAAWWLIESFVETGQVESIFLNELHHGRLYQAARALGMPKSRALEIVRSEAWRGTGGPIVQHAEGHYAHIHVRVRCGPDEPRCAS